MHARDTSPSSSTHATKWIQTGCRVKHARQQSPSLFLSGYNLISTSHHSYYTSSVRGGRPRCTHRSEERIRFALWQIDTSVRRRRTRRNLFRTDSMLDARSVLSNVGKKERKKEEREREKRNEERKVANNDLLRIRTNRRKMKLCDSAASE